MKEKLTGAIVIERLASILLNNPKLRHLWISRPEADALIQDWCDAP